MRNVGIFALALAFNAGTLKGIGLPGPDLTVTALVVAAGAALYVVLRDGLAVGWPRAILLVTAFISVCYTLPTPIDQYARDKILGLLLITVPLMAIAPILVSTKDDVIVLLRGLFLIGLLATLAVDTGLGAVSNTGRLSLGEGNPLNLGRTVGLAAVAATALALHRRLHPLIYFPATVFLVVTLYQGENRGPLIAGLICLFLGIVTICGRLVTLHPSQSTWTPGPWVVIACIAGFLAELTFSGHIPGLGSGRVADFAAQGDLFASAARQGAFQDALGAASGSGLGRGWGSFGQFSSAGLAYPHNLLLEVAVEAGWISSLLLLGWIVWTLKKVLGPSAPAAILALPVIFTLANAMWSGDVNGNRSFLALAAIVACMARPPRRPTTPLRQRSIRTELPEPARPPVRLTAVRSARTQSGMRWSDK